MGRLSAVRHGLVVAGVLFGIARGLALVAWDDPVDAHAYWSARLDDLYGRQLGTLDAYFYAPAVAREMAPLTMLLWPVFLAGRTALSVAVLVYVAGPLAAVLLFLQPVAAVPLLAADRDVRALCERLQRALQRALGRRGGDLRGRSG